MKILFTVLFCLCVLVGCGKKGEVGLKKEATLTPETKTKKTGVQMHGFKGQVRSVKVRGFKIEENSGNLVRTEGPIQSTSNYDEKGNSAGDTLYYSANGKIYSSYTYKYDERGNMVERVHNEPNGKIYDKTIYKYDEKGNSVGLVECDSSGKITRKNIRKYDEKGNKVEEEEYDGSGKSIFKSTSSVTTKGTWLRRRLLW